MFFFYPQFLLNLNEDKVASKFKSGGKLLERGLSSGKQDFDTDRNLWPVNKPMPKLESVFQTSGEAEYINDIPIKSDEVFCVLTLAPAIGTISKIEYEEAMVLILP